MAARPLLSMLLPLSLLVAAPVAAIPIDAPADQWHVVDYTAAPDWADDQATGANEADIVGDGAHAALYTFFDDLGTPSLTDGTLGFRLRLGSDDNPGGFKHVAVVGIDIDLNATADILIVVDNKGGTPEVAIRPVIGDGSSPAQTAIDTSGGVVYTQTAANYAWQAVSVLSDPGGTNTDIDGDGKTDYFLSFSVNFADLVAQLGGAIDQTSTVAYLAGTSTNSNSVNQDWAGPNGGAGSTTLWTTPGFGAFSNQMTVPEPATAAMLALGLLGLGLAARRSRRRAQI